MYKYTNLIMSLMIILFVYFILNYYLSNKNIKAKNYNRSNINQILKEKISNLPVIENDTNNVIEFKDVLKNDINENKKRSFWDLLKKNETQSFNN